MRILVSRKLMWSCLLVKCIFCGQDFDSSLLLRRFWPARSPDFAFTPLRFLEANPSFTLTQFVIAVNSFCGKVRRKTAYCTGTTIQAEIQFISIGVYFPYCLSAFRWVAAAKMTTSWIFVSRSCSLVSTCIAEVIVRFSYLLIARLRASSSGWKDLRSSALACVEACAMSSSACDGIPGSALVAIMTELATCASNSSRRLAISASLGSSWSARFWSAEALILRCRKSVRRWTSLMR